LLEPETGRRNTILDAPSVEKAYRAIKTGISRHKTVVVVGNCWVD